MKYFAKYLPVEGEIKEGDLFGWYSSTGGFLYRKWDESYKEVENLNQFKIKLFLCSRDIQVGDEIKFSTHNSKNKQEDGTIVFFQSENSVTVKTSTGMNIDTHIGLCYKIIGEISPEAKWVKEGDEFGEEEIKEVKYLDYGGWVPEMKVRYYQVLGPCKHFH